MPGEILLQDPYYEYAISFMRHCYQQYGLKSVCFYTDPAERREQSWKFPELRSEMVSASYSVDPADLTPLIIRLKRQHDIKAVIPFMESAVLPASEIAEELGLSWAQPEVIERFRDKAALKNFLATAPDAPRLNFATVVRDVASVRTASRECGSDRFVLKPNDGTGNQQVGFFSGTTPDSELSAYFEASGGHSVLFEEFIDGREYFVTGQVDAEGNITTLAAFECMVTAVNGRANVPSAFRIVNTFEDQFGPLTEYAGQVIRASGLRRSPFHVDIKIDDRGPWLIEAGARLAGVSTAYDVGIVHGGELNVIGLAAHYYLTDEPHGDVPLNWESYDSRAYALILGISHGRGVMYEVSGRKQVESTNGFVRWIRQPEPGRLFKPTVDLYSVPWILSLSADDQHRLMKLSKVAHQSIQWNDRSTGMARLTRLASAVWIDVKKKAHEIPTPKSVKPVKLSGRSNRS